MYGIRGSAATAVTTRSPALWWRIAALLIFVFASTLLLVSFLNYSNYRKTYLNLNQTRYLVSLKELRQTIEYGMNVGLPPSANMYLMPALNDLLKRQDGIRYIAVVDDTGKMISTGTLPAGANANWRALRDSTVNDAYWQNKSPAVFELGMPFTNNFGNKAGVVVIGYDRTAIEQAIEQMLRNMALQFAINLAMLSALTLVIVYILTRNFSTTIARVTHVIDNAMRSDGACSIDDKDIDMTTAKDLIDFVHLSQQASRELTILESEIAASGNGSGMQGGLA